MKINNEKIESIRQHAEKVIHEVADQLRLMPESGAIGSWLISAIERSASLSRRFGMSASPESKEALLQLLQSQEPLAASLSSMLATRVRIYLSSVGHLIQDELVDGVLKSSLVPLMDLRNLARSARPDNFAPSVSTVAKALKHHRLDGFRDEWTNTDLKVILRALHSNRQGGTKSARDELLKFLISQIRHEASTSGYVPEPRHAWWAIETVIDISDDDFLEKSKATINKAITKLLTRYEDTFKGGAEANTVCPELLTSENERLWAVINIARILCSEYCVHIPHKLQDQCIDILNEKLDSIGQSTQEQDLVKRALDHLLLCNEVTRIGGVVEAVNIIQSPPIHLRSYRIGRYYYSAQVANVTQGLFAGLQPYFDDPGSCAKPVLTAAMVCGGAGQGKSEFAAQMAAEIQTMASAKALDAKLVSLAVGKQLNSNEELIAKISELYANTRDKDVTVVVFDEIDKADFDFHTPFLTTLEDGAIRGVVVSIFAQSSFLTKEAYQLFAQEKGNNALRDFLTRIGWGWVTLPQLSLSPDQRLMSAIGMIYAKYGAGVRFSQSWCAYFLNASKIKNNRELRIESERVTKLESGIIRLKGASKYPELLRRVVNDQKLDWIVNES